MIDANSQFFAILTNVGLAKQANADALGIPWKITDMGLGDANLAGVADPPNPVPSPTQTKLINEWRRRPLNQLKIDPANPAIIIAEQIVPADEGGRWIREIGLYDEAGDLVAVANCAPSYKPLLSQGSGRTQVVRMNFIVSNAGNITLKIDPAVVLASRAYVDAAILEVLPKNKTPGEWTRVKTNDRGVVVSGDNPSTLAEMGITDTYTKTQIEAMIA
nr:phage tail protein [Pseudomonas azerbaijanoccidentalis]